MKKKRVFKNIVEPGTRFGRLTVLGLDDDMSQLNGCKMIMCQCDCGNKALVRQLSLTSGKTNSCGCLRKEVLHDHMSQRNDKKIYYHGAYLKIPEWTELLGVGSSTIYRRLSREIHPSQVINWPQESATTYVDFTVEEGCRTPERKSILDAGVDMFSTADFDLEFFVTNSMDLGVRVQLPPLTYGILKSRSGISLKGLPVMVRRDGVEIPGLVKMRIDTGTIDCNYRGNLGLTFTVEPYYPRKGYREELLEKGILFGNFSADSFYIPGHSKICQFIVQDYRADEWRKMTYLNTTDRGRKGFGSSGV